MLVWRLHLYHQSGGTFEEKRARSSNLCYGFSGELADFME